MNLVNVVKRRAQSVMDSVRATALAFRLFFLGLIGLSLSTGAHAAAIDVSAVIASIAEGVTVITSIGVAILSLVVVIKLFKWVQRTL